MDLNFIPPVLIKWLLETCFRFIENDEEDRVPSRLIPANNAYA